MTIIDELLLANEYVRAAIILALAFVAANGVYFFLKHYARKLISKTTISLDAEREYLLLKAIARETYLLIVFIGLYFAIKPLSILEPDRVAMETVFFVIFTLLAASIASTVIATWVGTWLRVQKRYEKAPKIINKVITTTIYVIAFLIILSYFKIEITPILTTLGIAGLAVGLAL